jgi:hypothetical protein
LGAAGAAAAIRLAAGGAAAGAAGWDHALVGAFIDPGALRLRRTERLPIR